MSQSNSISPSNGRVARELSDALAGAVQRAAPSILFLPGRRGRHASATVIDPRIVVAAAHLVDEDGNVEMRRADGTTLAGRRIGFDPASDLIAIEADADLPAPVPAADRQPEVGHLVLAVGRVAGGVVAGVGVISGLPEVSRGPRAGTLRQVIQTSLSPFRGFSGGALIDAEGGLLGVSTSGLSRGGAWAVPLDDVRRVVDALKRHGHIRRGYLGVTTMPVRVPDFQGEGGGTRGLLVTGVAPQSPAASAPLLVGDILVDAAGEPVGSPDELAGRLTAELVGSALSLRLLRGGRLTALDVIVGEREAH